MKKLLLILLCLPMIGFGQNVNIPDANFKAYLVWNSLINTNGDSEIQVSEATVFNGAIQCANWNISDLTGIEAFTALTNLQCGANQLTSLDVSNNTALTYLWCADNQLTSLDVSNNTALTYLLCADNQLTNLDVSQNTALTQLYCNDNQLTSLDVSNNTALTDLLCAANQLTSLDVSNNTALTDLLCAANQLTSLDVNGATALAYLDCYENNLTSLDVSQNTALTNLDCYENNLTSLDVNGATALTYLWCADNQLTSLDVSQNTTLHWFRCESNQLTSLDVSQNTALIVLWCADNQLTSLDVSQNTALISFTSDSNQLTSLDVSNNTALTYLWCADNQLTSLDVSNNTALTYLLCADNQLTSLDVRNGNNINIDFNCSNNPNLYCIDVDDTNYSNANWLTIDSWTSFSTNCATAFGCTNPIALNYDSIANIDDGSCIILSTYIPDDNFEAYLEANGMGNGILNDDSVYTPNINTLTSLDVSGQQISDLTGIAAFNSLTTLDCSFNQLDSLNLSNHPTLEELTAEYSGGANLDVSGSTMLSFINCNGNYLTDVNVNGVINLEKLWISNFQGGGYSLTNLDVSTNINLIELWCSFTGLSSLDVSGATALTTLRCEENQLTSLDVSTNTALTFLDCSVNYIECLDISNNLVLTNLDCNNNLLEQLNTRNSNWQNLYVNALNNNLTCVEVDNIGTATNDWDFDSFTTITTNCNYTNSCNMTYGCTDSLACNYDTLATISDSSCIYINTSVSISNVSCNGFTDGSVVATANGGATPNYQYSLSGGVSQTNGTFSNLAAGTYFIDVTDINGCSSNQTVIITEPNPLFVNAFSTDISCFGYCDGSAFCMPSGGTSPYSYLWSGGNTFVTDNISGLCAGAYVVNITDANNCINIETVLISEPLPLVSNNTINGCDSVLIGSNYYTISGAYTDTLISVNGCDSVVNTNLTIEQNTSSYDTLSVGASIVWNGMPLNVSGDYSVSLINSVGCDSIVNLNLTVTTTGISDIVNNKSNLVKITDMLGQETPYRRNTPLFYIYDDGTVEKRIVIE